MKINNRQESVIILGKSEIVSKKDGKTFYTLNLYIKDTEETVKVYVETVGEFNHYEKLKEYKLDLTHIHNVVTGKLSTYIMKNK